MEPFKAVNADDLTLDQIELLEKLSLRLAFQAVVWFAPQAWDIFDRSPDEPQDIAEDSTQEALGMFKGFSINERLFGTIDFKQARWMPLSFGLVPQALMVDSKAKLPNSKSKRGEKANLPKPKSKRGGVAEENRLDLQMSQVSMLAHLPDSKKGESRGPNEPKLNKWMDLRFEGNRVARAITSLVTVHYSYDVKGAGQVGNRLRKIIVSAVPNGLLQDRYSPSKERTIFGAGKHSPGRKEEPRVRIYYKKLRSFALWRVQEINFAADGIDRFEWKDVDEQGNPVTSPVYVEARLKMPGAGPAHHPDVVPASPPDADGGSDEVDDEDEDDDEEEDE